MPPLRGWAVAVSAVACNRASDRVVAAGAILHKRIDNSCSGCNLASRQIVFILLESIRPTKWLREVVCPNCAAALRKQLW